MTKMQLKRLEGIIEELAVLATEVKNKAMSEEFNKAAHLFADMIPVYAGADERPAPISGWKGPRICEKCGEHWPPYGRYAPYTTCGAGRYIGNDRKMTICDGKLVPWERRKDGATRDDVYWQCPFCGEVVRAPKVPAEYIFPAPFGACPRCGRKQ